MDTQELVYMYCLLRKHDVPSESAKEIMKLYGSDSDDVDKLEELYNESSNNPSKTRTFNYFKYSTFLPDGKPSEPPAIIGTERITATINPEIMAAYQNLDSALKMERLKSTWKNMGLSDVAIEELEKLYTPVGEEGQA